MKPKKLRLSAPGILNFNCNRISKYNTNTAERVNASFCLKRKRKKKSNTAFEEK